MAGAVQQEINIDEIVRTWLEHQPVVHEEAVVQEHGRMSNQQRHEENGCRAQQRGRARTGEEGHRRKNSHAHVTRRKSGMTGPPLTGKIRPPIDFRSGWASEASGTNFRNEHATGAGASRCDLSQRRASIAVAGLCAHRGHWRIRPPISAGLRQRHRSFCDRLHRASRSTPCRRRAGRALLVGDGDDVLLHPVQPAGLGLYADVAHGTGQDRTSPHLGAMGCGLHAGRRSRHVHAQSPETPDRLGVGGDRRWQAGADTQGVAVAHLVKLARLSTGLG